MIVYLHKRKLDNQVFYVGIGTKRRAISKSSRNKHWRDFVSKYEYYVEITHSDIIREEACMIEKYLIEFYRNNSKICLTNKTNGGDGADSESSLNMNKIRWDKDKEGKVKLGKYNRENKSKKVLKINLDGKVVSEYYSARQAARENNMSQATISKCCNGSYKTSKKHRWQYAK